MQRAGKLRGTVALDERWAVPRGLFWGVRYQENRSMTDCISLSNCFFPSVSFPVTRYSTDTPRARAILKAESTDGKRACVICCLNVPRFIPKSEQSDSCVMFNSFIRLFTRFQKSIAFISNLSAKKVIKK